DRPAPAAPAAWPSRPRGAASTAPTARAAGAARRRRSRWPARHRSHAPRPAANPRTYLHRSSTCPPAPLPDRRQRSVTARALRRQIGRVLVHAGAAAANDRVLVVQAPLHLAL